VGETTIFDRGALNLAKCFWFLLSWRWIKGKASLHTPETAPGTLQMTPENDKTAHTIKRIEPSESYRTLGVQYPHRDPPKEPKWYFNR